MWLKSYLFSHSLMTPDKLTRLIDEASVNNLTTAILMQGSCLPSYSLLHLCTVKVVCNVLVLTLMYMIGRRSWCIWPWAFDPSQNFSVKCSASASASLSRSWSLSWHSLSTALVLNPSSHTPARNTIWNVLAILIMYKIRCQNKKRIELLVEILTCENNRLVNKNCKWTNKT